MDVIARDLAVEVVDAIHGYTMEFAGSPEAHRAEYDAAERIIARALNNQGAVEEAIREHKRALQAHLAESETSDPTEADLALWAILDPPTGGQ